MKNTLKEPVNYWGSDDFEDLVASSLVAAYETKIKNGSGLKKKHLEFLRETGVYIPSDSREIIYDTENEAALYDVLNDGVPNVGFFGIGSTYSLDKHEFKGYFSGVSFRRITQTPKGIVRQDQGALYEQLYVCANNKNVDGQKAYFTLNRNGVIKSCQQHGYNRDGKIVFEEDHVLKASKSLAAMSLHFLADSRFCWSITAQEHSAKASLGCMKEEVKSLLYARSLPMTATGRKRPILHLVESHKRRMKNGIDIDITPFLRGTQKIEMNGTVFSVNPPTHRMNDLSKNSIKYY